MDDLDKRIAIYKAEKAYAMALAEKQKKYNTISKIVHTIVFVIFVIGGFMAYTNKAKAGEYIELVDIDAQSLVVNNEN